jgi:hypothetical protein
MMRTPVAIGVGADVGARGAGVWTRTVNAAPYVRFGLIALANLIARNGKT